MSRNEETPIKAGHVQAAICALCERLMQHESHSHGLACSPCTCRQCAAGWANPHEGLMYTADASLLPHAARALGKQIWISLLVMNHIMTKPPLIFVLELSGSWNKVSVFIHPEIFALRSCGFFCTGSFLYRYSTLRSRVHSAGSSSPQWFNLSTEPKRSHDKFILLKSKR